MKKFLCVMMAAILLCACGLAAAEGTETPEFKVTAPEGAPALALATLAAENPDNYTFVAADTLPAAFASAEADFIVAPVNAGAKLFKAGKSTYRLGAVVSWGNLVFASRREGFTTADLNGAHVVLFGENTINAAIALFVMEKNGLVPESVEYLAGAANTQALLLSDENAIVMTAEPALTAARMKNESVQGYSVREMYQAATGFDGFPQAALFIREETLKEQKDAVDAFLAQVKESCALAETDVEKVAEAAAKLEILPNAKVAAAALPNCAIRYLSAAEAKEQIETAVAIDPTQFGGAVPADDFYYGLE